MGEELRSAPESGQSSEHVPLLSITVLNYNYAHYLPQCLDSILRQTFTDFELLLINDCSTDNSLEVIRPYLADPRINFINHEQNKGYIYSLIEGSDRSRGKYLTVISADDYCVSDRAFETLLGMLEANPDAAWAHAAFGLYNAEGERVIAAQHHAQSYVRPGNEEYPDLLLRKSYVLHSGTIIRTSAYRAVGGYDPRVRYSCDTKMWLTLCHEGRSAYSHEELYANRKHDSNMSLSVDGIRKGLREHLEAIDATFPVMRPTLTANAHLYRVAMKRNLIANAEEAMFGGHVLAGWYTLWCAAKMHPVWTIFQVRVLHLVGRTVLGARGFHWLHSSVKSLTHRGSVAAPNGTLELYPQQ